MRERGRDSIELDTRFVVKTAPNLHPFIGTSENSSADVLKRLIKYWLLESTNNVFHLVLGDLEAHLTN